MNKLSIKPSIDTFIGLTKEKDRFEDKYLPTAWFKTEHSSLLFSINGDFNPNGSINSFHTGKNVIHIMGNDVIDHLQANCTQLEPEAKELLVSNIQEYLQPSDE